MFCVSEELIPILNERAGFPLDTELDLYEEIKPNMVERIENLNEPLEKVLFFLVSFSLNKCFFFIFFLENYCVLKITRIMYACKLKACFMLFILQ